VNSLSHHNITDEQRLEVYDRLATRWAEKMEERMARKRILLRHPNLVVTFKRQGVHTKQFQT
jgi:hypothetical protein